MGVKILSIFAYILLALAPISLIFQKSLFATEYILVGVQVLAITLMLWTRISFGMRSFHIAANPTEGGLVTTGPYKYISYGSLLFGSCNSNLFGREININQISRILRICKKN